jgi:sugar O-acyltransferase (sialic acid O-acetyltransferase NeuD family)
VVVKPVVIFGAGDFARIAYVSLVHDSPHTVAAFTVHERLMPGPELLGVPVVPFETLLDRHPPDAFAMLVAVGFSRVNRARAEVYAECKRLGYELVTYVSSRATCWGDVEIGENSFVCEAAVLQPFVRIGADTVLWSGSHVGHDTVIGDHVFIAPRAAISGNCRIGPYCFVGVNATVRDGIAIPASCVIGAGAVVMTPPAPEAVLAVRGTPPLPRTSAEIDL